MAYLGNGIYDLLDVVRASNNPQINYEGLYQDAPSNIATSNLLQAMQPQYEYRNSNYINNLINKNAFDLSGNVPVDFNRQVDFKNYLNNQPLRSNYKSLARFEDFNPRVGIMNAGLPINNTNSITPINNTSLGFDTSYGVANEEDEEDVEGARRTGGLADLLRTAISFAIPGASFLMNTGRGALQGIQSLNQRFRNTMFGQSATGAEFFQKLRDKRAREEAAKRGALKQKQIIASQQVDTGDIGGGGAGSSFDAPSGGTFGSSVNDASSFSDYS